MKVAVVMGSKSDLPKLESMIDLLIDWGVDVDVRVLSAHRAHHELQTFIEDTKVNGTEVIIGAAGKAAHLPGVMAAMTVTPVIGVPIAGSKLDGMDALYSIVQMPTGMPVATVAIDGGDNAALLALQIIGNKYPEIKEKLIAYREEIKQANLKANEEVMAKYSK